MGIDFEDTMSRFFRATQFLLQRTKTTTGITGLAVHPDPLPHLLKTYTATSTILSKMPAGAVYRQSVESIIKERREIVERLQGQNAESDIEAVVSQAEDELQLAGKMLDWKAWEDLANPPAPGQWEPFGVTASNTNADEYEKSR